MLLSSVVGLVEISGCVPLYVGTQPGGIFKYENDAVGWRYMDMGAEWAPVLSLAESDDGTLPAETRGARIFRFQSAPLSIEDTRAVQSGSSLSVLPNPSSSSVRITLPDNRNGHIVVTTSTLLGEQVGVIADGESRDLRRDIEWHADGVSAGTYLCTMRDKQSVRTARIAIAR